MLVWFVCTCLHIGQSGKYSDDYTITMRVLATDQIDWSLHPWARYPYFWRPLHLALLWGVGTFAWHHDWIAHALSALAHGTCSLLLALWLVRMGLRLPAAAIAALLFMSHTLHAEAINWFSTICVSLGGAFMLVVFELARRASTTSPLSVGRVLAVACMTFLTACWYESPAAACAAIPLVMLAAGTHHGRLQERLRRTIPYTCAAGIACVVYAVLLIATAPAWQRGGQSRMTSAGGLAQRVGDLARELPGWLVGSRGRELWLGAWREGVESLLSPLGVVIAAFLLAAGAWACTRSKVVQVPTHSRLFLVTIGMAVFLLAWLPIALVKDNSIELRIWYTPLIGLAIAIAPAIDALLSHRRWARVPFVIVCLLAIFAGTLSHAGWQRVFLRVWRNDLARAASLRSTIPNPPAAAAFVVLRSHALSASTGSTAFDHAVQPALSNNWSSWGFVQHAYRRRDLTATALAAGVGRAHTPLPLTGFDQHGVWSTTNYPGPYQRSERGCFLPWNLVVPIGLTSNTPEERTGVRVYSRVIVERPDGQDLDIFPSLTAHLPTDHQQTLTLLDPDANWGRRAPHWTRSEGGATGERTPLLTTEVHGIERPHIRISPGNTATDTLHLTLPPADYPRTMLIRWTLEPNARADSGADSKAVTSTPAQLAPVTLVAYARPQSTHPTHPDASAPAIATSNSQADGSARWQPLLLHIPPSADPIVVELTVASGLATSGGVLVHRGWVLR